MPSIFILGTDFLDLLDLNVRIFFSFLLKPYLNLNIILKILTSITMFLLFFVESVLSNFHSHQLSGSFDSIALQFCFINRQFYQFFWLETPFIHLKLKLRLPSF